MRLVRRLELRRGALTTLSCLLQFVLASRAKGASPIVRAGKREDTMQRFLLSAVAIAALTLTAGAAFGQSGDLKITWIDVEGGAATLFVIDPGEIGRAHV